MKMKKRISMFVMAGLLAIGCALPVFADDIEKDSADNAFIAGDSVTVTDLSSFGVIAAGQNIEMSDLDAEGSLMAAGQIISVSGADIGESVCVAGNTITLNNVDAHGNIFAAAGTVNILGDTSSKGVYAFAGKVVFEGQTESLNASGQSVVIKGEINGDADISAESVEIAEGAVITGTLSVHSSSEPVIADSAQIGDLDFEAVEADDDDDSISASGLGGRIFKKFTSSLYWIVAMAAFGMLLCWLFGRHIEEAAVMIRQKTAAMIVTGVIAWMCIPVAVILLCISMILAPTGGIIGLAYVLLLCAGLAFAGCSISRIVLPKMNIFLSSLIGIAVLEAFRAVPVLGTLVGIAADMYLLGYVILHLWENRFKKEAS